MEESTEKRNAKNIIEIRNETRLLKCSWISTEFDIVRYILIFLMIFGHNLGTNLKSQAKFADAFHS
jgi:hypothetical protein